MIIDGKPYISGETMCALVGWTDENFSIPSRKPVLDRFNKVKVDREWWFCQKEVYEYCEEKAAKARMLYEVQALVMFILDELESIETKYTISKKLGFAGSNPHTIMNTWLKNTMYTKTVARVLVMAKKNYPDLLAKYDREYAA